MTCRIVEWLYITIRALLQNPCGRSSLVGVIKIRGYINKMFKNKYLYNILHWAILIGVPLLSPAAAWAQQGVAFVLNSNDDTVSLIDTKTYKEISRERVGREPHHVMITPDRKSLIVGNVQSNDLVFFDPVSGAFQKRIPGISDAYQMAFSHDKKWFVTASLALDRVDIYSADDYKLVKRLATPKGPSHLVFSTDNRHVFVTLQHTNNIAIIDLIDQKLVATVPVGKQPAGIWITPDDKHVLVGVMGEDFVAVVDWRARKVTQKIRTGLGAHNFMPMGDQRRILVTNRAVNTVSILDMQTLKVLETFPVPGGPDCMELTADGKELWVTSRWIQKVTVIDMETRKVKTQIPVGRSPHGIFFNHHAPRF